MNRVAESYKIVEGKIPLLVDWVSRGLGEKDSHWAGENYHTVAFIAQEKLVGVLVCHDLHCGDDVWWTIYTNNKKWCNRKVLKHIFHLAFEDWGCRRINLAVSKNNYQSLNLVRRLGFCEEGCLREFRHQGEDVILFGMLKNECKWKDKK